MVWEAPKHCGQTLNERLTNIDTSAVKQELPSESNDHLLSLPAINEFRNEGIAVTHFESHG